jgi:hypothetical protein
MGSRPVRIGNSAYTHLQLDIYGELMDSVYLYDKYGSPIGYDAWMNIARLIDWTCEHWREKDESIWEVRGGRQEFLYSRVMCWGGDRPRHPPREQALVPGSHVALVRGAGHHLPATIFERFWDQGAAGSSSTRARPHSTPRPCSCRWCDSCRRPTRAGLRRFAASSGSS